MASQHSGTNHQRDDKSRERQQDTQQDQKGNEHGGGSSGGKGNPGNHAHDPDRARKSGRNGSKS